MHRGRRDEPQRRIKETAVLGREFFHWHDVAHFERSILSASPTRSTLASCRLFMTLTTVS